ncbi:MAG: DNA repair protein RecN [Planctomycetota bacterium]|jgi:DNA repair protein RecN (Recombination protein N)
MLVELSVRNLVILEQARIEPGPGLTVISGETGAGKSLLLDALDLLLGGRAQAGLIGPAADSATVAGVFELAPDRAARIAGLIDVPASDGQIILRRRLTAAGRSQAWVNDVPVAIAALKRIGGELVDIRVQNEHLRLGQVERQLTLLDRYGGHQELTESYRCVDAACRRLAAELVSLDEGERDSLRELDYLRFVVEELNAFAPQPGELAALEERQTLLAEAGTWQQIAGEGAVVLDDGEGAVAATLGRLAHRLQSAPSAALRDAGDCCRQAHELVRDAARACQGAVETLELDPAELTAVEERLAGWHDLLRKHGSDEAAVLAAWQDASERIAALEGLAERRRQVLTDVAAAQADRARIGAELAAARRAAFAVLAERVHSELAELGMAKARLSLAEETLLEPGLQGSVRQEFLVQTNPGLEPGPLRSIASGGESARLTLALAVALGDQDDTPVLIFDEIDAGVGGRLGSLMGRKLADLAVDRSVLAVTHTPQLAAAAQTNYMLRKCQGESATTVNVTRLEGDALVCELADMLGGGTAARQQASALLAGERGSL